MRFATEHRFNAPPDVVAEAMVDAGYLADLRLPDVDVPEIQERRDDGRSVTTRVRFRYTGALDAVALRVLRGAEIAWVQEVVLDRPALRATFAVVPDVHGDRLRCRGDYTLHADGDGTHRAISGELTVRVPLVAARAERMIVPGVVRRLDVEAERLGDWLARSSG
jgi:hypothetical protein